MPADVIYLKDLQEVSIPDLADVLLGRDTSDTVERKFAVERLLGLFNNVFQARLTTETGVAVSTSDRTSQSTLYLTPYNGNKVSVYDGTRWVLYAMTERSLTLSGLTADKNYDVFLYERLEQEWENSGRPCPKCKTLMVDDHVQNNQLTRPIPGNIYGTIEPVYRYYKCPGCEYKR